MAIDDISGNYENKSFAVPDATVDGSWKALAGAFSEVKTAKSAVIKSDRQLTLKFGVVTTKDPIVVTLAEFPFSWVGVFEDILITNASGFPANVEVILR